MKRFAFYMTSFEGGGAERVCALIACELARRGHSVLILVDRDTGQNRQILDASIQVAALPHGYLARVLALRRYLRAWNADVVFACLGLCPIIAVLAQGVWARWRTVISFHACHEPQTSLGVRLTWWLIALLSRRASATFGVSQDIADQLVRFGASKTRTKVIHNPVAMDWVQAQLAAPSDLILALPRPYILSVGRLVPQKGYPDLIAAYALIAHKIREDLVILGVGPLEAQLRAQIAAAGLQDRIHLPGYAANPFPHYARARLFVLASHFEGFGNVLIEALACGTPIVATNCPGGPRDILQHGAFGTLAPTHDPAALAQAMLAALAAPKQPQNLINRAHDFDSPKIATLYEEIAFAQVGGVR